MQPTVTTERFCPICGLEYGKADTEMHEQYHKKSLMWYEKWGVNCAVDNLAYDCVESFQQLCAESVRNITMTPTQVHDCMRKWLVQKYALHVRGCLQMRTEKPMTARTYMRQLLRVNSKRVSSEALEYGKEFVESL